MADIDEIRSGRRRDWWGRREQQRKDKLSRSPLDQMKKLIRESNSPTEVPAEVQHTTGVLKDFLAANADSRSEPPGAAGPDDAPDGASAESRPVRLPKRGTHEWGLHIERQRYLREWQQTRRQLIFLAIAAGAVLVLIGGGYGFLFYALRQPRTR